MPTGTPNPPSMRGITRDRKAWKVGVQINGILHRKSFRFGDGSNDQLAFTLVRAKAWRDATVAAHPEVAEWFRIERLLSGNRPGGISRLPERNGRPAHWRAETPLGDGELLWKNFSIEEHGKHAKVLAIAERERQLELMKARFLRRASEKARMQALNPVVDPNSMYGIECKGETWLVHIRRNTVLLVKRFPFNTYGNSESALAQARAWRDEIVQSHPQPERRVKAQRITSRNTTGNPGVVCRFGPDGEPRQWIAQTFLGEKWLSKCFNVKRYGDRARELAIVERERQLEQMTGRFARRDGFNPPPG